MQWHSFGDVVKGSNISSVVSTRYTRVTDGRTDTARLGKGKDAVVLRMELRRGAHLPFAGH